jgi:hypothetical protein
MLVMNLKNYKDRNEIENEYNLQQYHQARHAVV